MQETKDGTDEEQSKRRRGMRRMSVSSHAQDQAMNEMRNKIERTQALIGGKEASTKYEPKDQERLSFALDNAAANERHSLTNDRNSLQTSSRDSRSNNFTLPEYVAAFGIDTGYHPFNLRYRKHLYYESLEDKVNRGYTKHGSTVLVHFPEEFDETLQWQDGVVVRHYNYFELDEFGHKVHVVSEDTCDIVLRDGSKVRHVSVDRLVPTQIIVAPLACGFSLQDFCLILTCVCCFWTFLAALFGLLMLATTETSADGTALITFLLATLVFMVGLVVWTNVNRIVAEMRAEDTLLDDEDFTSNPQITDVEAAMLS